LGAFANKNVTCKQAATPCNFKNNLTKKHMDFKSWFLQTKIDNPDLEIFITKLEPFFTDVGFNGIEFEKKINNGLRMIDTEINELLKPESNVENQ
jgi:hypothetical protein